MAAGGGEDDGGGRHMVAGGGEDDGGRLHKKRKMPPTLCCLLNQDIIFDILTRLPAKSLIRFKAASRFWYTLISHSYFIKSHMNKNRKNDGSSFLIWQRIVSQSSYSRFVKEINRMIDYIDETISRMCFYMIQQQQHHHHHHNTTKWSMEFHSIKDFPVESTGGIIFPMIQHCDGLLLTITPPELYIYNPATRELLHLPPSCNLNKPDMDIIDQVGIGFDRSTNKYKVVRYFYRWRDTKTSSCSLGFEVFTLGSSSADSCWRQTTQDSPYPVMQNCVASVEGAVYWNIDNSLHTSAPIAAILRFDLSHEKFTLIPPPPPFLSDLSHLDFTFSTYLTELQGNLGCVYLRNFTAEVWMMSKELETWSLIYRFSFTQNKRLLIFPIVINQGNLVFSSADRLYSYDPKKESYAELMKCDSSNGNANAATVEDSDMWYQFISYVESLVPIRAPPELGP